MAFFAMIMENNFKGIFAPVRVAFSEKQTGMEEAVLALWLSVARH